MAVIPRRKVFFVACEGYSEQGYAAFLKKLADGEGLHIHIDAKTMTPGNAMTLVEQACREIEQRDGLKGKFLMLDTDQMSGGQPNPDHKIYRKAEAAGLTLIWQNICFESFLLRHFKDHENDNPATSPEALKKLKKVWPEYKKGMSAMDLMQRITLTDVRRAARNPLNEDLRILLKALGLL